MVKHLLTALVCAQNITQSTTTSTVTKTVFHTVTTSVNLATLPGSASSCAAASDVASADELKSVYVQTIELTSTIFSTEVDGIVVTSLSTVIAPVASTAVATATATTVLTDFEEVTSTNTKQISTTITTTSVVVSVTTSAAATSTSIEQQIAQMWGMSGSERLVIGNWLVFNLVVLSFVHYLFFAH